MQSTTQAELVETDAQRAPESRDDERRAQETAAAAAARSKQDSRNYVTTDQGRAIEVEQLNSANDGGAA